MPGIDYDYQIRTRRVCPRCDGAGAVEVLRRWPFKGTRKAKCDRALVIMQLWPTIWRRGVTARMGPGSGNLGPSCGGTGYIEEWVPAPDFRRWLKAEEAVCAVCSQQRGNWRHDPEALPPVDADPHFEHRHTFVEVHP